MYLDAVVDKDMKPVFNDIPDNVREWLQSQPNVDNYDVVVGSTLEVLSATKYLKTE